MARDEQQTDRQRLRFAVMDLLTHLCWMIVKIGNDEFATMALERIEEIRAHLKQKIVRAEQEDEP